MTEKWIEAQMTTTKLDDIICNRCKKSCCVSTNDEFGEDEYKHIEAAVLMADWGYESSKDGERHRAHLCEPCYDEVLRACGIEPDITEY